MKFRATNPGTDYLTFIYGNMGLMDTAITNYIVGGMTNFYVEDIDGQFFSQVKLTVT